jgi:hypothetical protein
MEGKKRVVPGEACTICSERSNPPLQDSAERTGVSRGHSSGIAIKNRINRSLKYDPERRRNGYMNAENKDRCLQRDSARNATGM